MKNFIILTSILVLGHSIAYANEEKICQKALTWIIQFKNS